MRSGRSRLVWSRTVRPFELRSPCPGAADRLRGKSTSSSCSNARPMAAPVSICCADECCSPHDSTQSAEEPKLWTVPPQMEEIGDHATVFEFGGLRDRQRDYTDWVLENS